MISARALGVLIEISSGEVNISAEAISKRVAEGRDAIRAALDELRDVGFVNTQRERINGRWVTSSQITDAGFRCLETRLLIPLALQNSNNTVILHSQDYKPTTPAEPVGEETMPYEFFESNSSMDADERVAERKKAESEKRAEYEERRAKNANKKFVERQSIPRTKWSSADVAYEFADRIHEHWHIKPWQVTKSRFIQALGTARKQHSTDGEIEVQAMERFFDSISIDKYDNAEVLWKMFIKRFPSFVGDIRNTVMPDTEVSDESRIRSAKMMERFLNNVQE